jgi:hypothetical protein
MGKHSRTARSRAYSALAAGLVGLGVMASVGTAQADDPAPVPGTPCTAVARACVDLTARQAWLIDEGTVVRGPVPISSGGPGRATPTGDFRVEWKHVNHRSTEFNNAPMPFSVFFAQGGIAFHEGNLHTPSSGCVRLAREDAIAFFDFLLVDDPVQVR